MNNGLKEIPGIYIFTNKINGKVYVGESINIYKRITNYKYPKKSLRPFESALIKYGNSEFNLIVEYFPDFSKNDLLDLEEELILRFGCISPNGYNLLPRGTVPTKGVMSDTTRKKISLAKMGNKNRLGSIPSKETREKLSRARKGKPCPMKGRRHSPESLLKMSASHRGKLIGSLSTSSKPVSQYSKDGLLINSFDSASTARRETGINHISCVCLGKFKTAGGYKWRYAS